jgi:hypothetical protein
MTERKITYALKKIASCKEQGYYLEALLKSYHLNVSLIKYMLASSDSGFSPKGNKIKTIVSQFVKEVTVNPALKSIITKRTLKIVRPWLVKMDDFFKKLKIAQPSHLSELLEETEKIFGILNISANKLLIKSKVA